MIDITRTLKASAAWISILWIICFVVVGLFPGIRPGFVRYGLHMGIDIGQNIFTFETFISGLVIWNIITFFGVWLFAFLYNKIKP